MRLRFPPSPTGYLHVGGARTALFNWLLAQKSGGTLVLRIEDTDQARSSEEHTRAILDGMRWLGLDWDEGPYFQSDGVERHRSQARRLLAEGKAYRDFSDPGELRAAAETMGLGHPSVLARRRATDMGEAEAVRRAEAGEPHALRLRVPEGSTGWVDLVHGPMRFQNEDIDDLVILRADGSPIYNLAVVSDDAEQGITHVVRGDDHLSNTPKQILLYEALGLPVPRFGHVPMILGSDGKRLSKRHGATAVGDYAGQGFLPEAMFNFLAFLGWNPGDERDVMSREELVEAFSLDRVQKGSAVFDTNKLEWLNGQYLASLPTEVAAGLLIPHLEELGVGAEAWAGDREAFHALVDLLKVRARTTVDMAQQALPFVRSELDGYEEDAVAKHWAKDPDAVIHRLKRLHETLQDVPWTEEALEESIRGLAADQEVGAGKMIHPLRLAVTGRGNSPGIFEVLVLLGRERSLKRLVNAWEHLAQNHTESA